MCYNLLRLGTLEEAALWMKEMVGYTFRHGTFEISIRLPDGAVLQDSKTDKDLGMLLTDSH